MEDTTPDATLNSRRKTAQGAAEALATQLVDSGSEPETEVSKGKRRATKQSGRNRKKAKTRDDAAPVNAPSQPASGDITPRPQLAISTQPMESASIITSSKPNVADVAEGASTMASTQHGKLPGLEDLSDLTDLTSLSSDEHLTSPDDVVPKPRRVAKPFPLMNFKDAILEATTSILTSSKVPSSIPVHSKAITSKASTSKSSSSAQVKQKSKQKHVYKDFSLGSYIWTLVNPETLNVYEDRPIDGEKGLWWPGKVQRCRAIDTPFEIRLFGQESKTVQILSPTKVNIILQPTPFSKMKFKNPTYVPRQSTSTGQIQTPDVDQEDIAKRWKGAVQDMRRDADIIAIDDSGSDADVASLSATDDDLPEYVTLDHSTSQSMSAPPKPFFSQGSSKGAAKKKGKAKERGKTTSVDIRRRAAEEPDMLLTIPGELVLAKDRLQTNIYWPAKIEEFVPAAIPSRPGKYRLTWVDSACQDVPREWFYIYSQPEFATCHIGKYLSFFEDKEDDPDEEDLTPPEEDRSPSPVPLDPPPSQEDFKQLAIRDQFAYTKEVLRAILDGRYAPSRQKHDDFIKGGKWRKNVANSAAMWGLMDPKDVKVVDKLVQKWCLRDEDEDEFMDTMADLLPQPIVFDIVQGEAKLGHDEVPNLLKEELALGDDTTPDVAVAEANPVDSSKKNSQSTELSLPSPEQPAEKVASATDGGEPAGSTEEDLQLQKSTESTEPDLASFDYVYPDSAMRFEPSSFPRPLNSSSPPPSSFMTSLPESSQSGILPATSEAPSSPPPSSLAPTAGTEDDVYDNISDLTAMEEDQNPSEAIAAPPKERVFVPFKSLTQLVQIEYCSTILVPEAVRQILLWRSGDRTQVGLLTPEEEQSLYDKGAKLLTERDWVFDVTRLREKKVAALRAIKAKSLKSVAGNSSISMSSLRNRNGSSSRPRRNLSIQNYQE